MRAVILVCLQFTSPAADLRLGALPAAVLSCFAKKVPKEATWGGFVCLAPAIQATSPSPLQAALSFLRYYTVLLKSDSDLDKLSCVKSRESVGLFQTR